MPVCVICMADGVLEVNGGWYCIDHMHEGLAAITTTIHQLSRHKLDGTDADLWEAFEEVLDDYGYVFPDQASDDDDD